MNQINAVMFDKEADTEFKNLVRETLETSEFIQTEWVGDVLAFKELVHKT
jgi:hypothetical protein